MKILNKMSMRTRLFSVFGILIFLLLAVMIVSYSGISSIQESQKTLFEKEYKTSIKLMKIRVDINAIRSAMLLVMATPDKSNSQNSFDEVDIRIKDVNLIFIDLVKINSANNEYNEQFMKLNTIWLEFEKRIIDEIIPLLKNGKKNEALHLSLGIQLERFNLLRKTVASLGDKADQFAAEAIMKSDILVNSSIRLFTLIGVIAILFYIILTLIIFKT